MLSADRCPPPPQDGAEHLKIVQNTSRWCRIPSIPASIGWFLTVLCLRIGQKVFLRWFAKFKKVLKKGVFKGFLAPAPEEFMGVWIWGIFFSAPECDNDLGLASPCMPTCPLEVIFSRIIPIFLARVGGWGWGCLLSSGPAHWSLWVSEALRQNTTRES